MINATLGLSRIAVFSLTLAASAASANTPPLVDAAALRPNAAEVRATQLITNFVENYHYKKTELDDALSQQTFDRYLENLDANRSFLTAEDVREFEIYRSQLDDQLERAQLDTAYTIFLRFRERLEARCAAAIKLLDQAFDFSVTEEYVFDRSKQAWANAAGLDEYWHKRVKNDVLSLRLTGKKADEIKTTLTKRYQDLRRRTDQLNAEDVYEVYINAYLNSIEPHTSYFSPRTSENFRIRMSLSLEGIGAVLQADNEYTLVKQVMKGGPADKSGLLHKEDRIVGVGQGNSDAVTDVLGWRLDDVVDLIRGKKGTQVRLQILPKGAGLSGPTKTITLTRNKIELEDEAAKSTLLEVGEALGKTKIGVVTLSAFYQDFDARARGDSDYRSTTRDVRKLIEQLTAQGAQGILMDLRGNGGGSLTEATELTGLFIDSGPVVQVRNADGSLHTERDTDNNIAYGGPLAVLVDENSASASEIFAAAIQDYQRGIILGKPTFGKGTVQNLVDLDHYSDENKGQLGQLKATIAQFFRINGESTQHRGVLPDMPFPTRLKTDEEGERSLPNALPWDRIAPANYTPAKAPTAEFMRVKSLLDTRLRNDRAFQLLMEQEQAVQTARDKTSLSLVESTRKHEQEKTEKELKERDAAFRALTGQPPAPIEDEAADADSMRDQDDEQDADKRYDVVLNAAAHVLSDLIVPVTQQASHEPVVPVAGVPAPPPASGSVAAP